MESKPKLCPQESIIDMPTILAAITEARLHKSRGPRENLDMLNGEPALQEFLKGSLLEIAGNMALNGCSSSTIRGIHHEVAFLLATTFSAVRQAYRELYADLLPQTEDPAMPVKPDADQDQAVKPDGPRKTDRLSKRKETKP